MHKVLHHPYASSREAMFKLRYTGVMGGQEILQSHFLSVLP